jgi:hypothetical protein
VRLPLVAALALSLAACQCGGPSGNDGGSGGGTGGFGGGGTAGGSGGAGGGGGLDACGGCPSGKVCEALTARCIGGCPAGQGTCASGCCPWTVLPGEAPNFYRSGNKPELKLDGAGLPHIVHRGRLSYVGVFHSFLDGGALDTEFISSVPNNENWQNGLLLEPDGGMWVGFSRLNANNTKDVLVEHLHSGGADYDILGDADFGTVCGFEEHTGQLEVLWTPFTLADTLILSRRNGRAPDAGYTDQRVAIPQFMKPSWTADLRIDASGDSHIAYGVSGPTGGVYYGRPFDGGFVFERVAGEVSISRVSLALGADGTAHLAYYQLGDQRLHYGRRLDGGWVTETVTALDGQGWYPSLALDDLGNAHVSYGDDLTIADAGTLHYAHRVGPSAWDLQTVDVGPGVGRESSLALDSARRPHIGYFDHLAGRIKYATLPGP